ncbi:PREDICTED: zinc finger CCCH domain-containing protein 65-like isoform X1 [Camelina sativa]|uniref:Zinc finger CCCH domain-containing protein 65-like isoform X1 n=1 Tax=Camelina sativa TaxID=90675 RepID=A0ABM0XAS0_CAMSA|nr:PREDICTED: zinc finger CCCH domain-containing protein 65-like isoform X1 [Camelina sativa]
MESSVATFPNRRKHLPNRTYRSLIHHLCSSFDREPRVSLATPAVLQELVLRTETAQASPGETCEPPENSSVVEPRSNVETISQGEHLLLGDVFDGIDLQDATVGSRHKDFFDDFELMINVSQDFVPESCVNLFEALDVNDYNGDGIVASLDDISKQPLDIVENVVEKPDIATEVQVDPVESDKKAEEVPKPAEVISSGVLEACNGKFQREMGLEKPVDDSTQVLVDSVPRLVEDDDVEEGEISGDENDDMLVGDDEPVERHEESHVSQEGIGNSHLTSYESFGKKLGVEVTNVDNRKINPGTSIKKRSAPSKDAKARKRAKDRKKRAQERIALGVKKLKLKTVAPKPKPIKYCRHYIKGRCHEGDKCKFSHDIIPETKSSPCCYFATQSCMKGDDCPYDHDLSKYPCNNIITKGFCHRGDSCLFSHKGTPQSASDTSNVNITASSTNITAASFSPQKTNKQSVREAIARIPAIQARVSSSVAFLKPLGQSNQRNSSDASSSKINEHPKPPQVPPLRKPSVAPKGMSFLSSDSTVKPSPASKPNTDNSDNQTLKQSQQGSFLPVVPQKGFSFLSVNREPQEPASSRNLKTTPNSHIQSSLHSAMKLAAEFESAKVERRSNDPVEAINKGDGKVNTSVTRNSGNVSSQILEFLSSFSHGKN